jgi:hypothetical protein
MPSFITRKYLGGMPFREWFLFNDAWEFDNINDTVLLPAAMNWDGHSAFSVATWIRPRTNFTSLQRTFIERFTSTSQAATLRYSPTNNAFEMQILSGAGITRRLSTLAPITVPDINTWLFVVAVFDGPNPTNWRVYRNAVDISGVASGPNHTYTPNLATSTYLGSRSGSSTFFLGSMDETTLFNKALSPAEVAHLYNLGGGNLPPASALANLVARYSFNTAVPSGGNFVLVDDSGNGNNGLSSGIAVSPLIPH